MNLIKKIAIVALTSIMIVTSVYAIPVNAQSFTEDKSVVINGRTVTMKLSGDDDSITASTIYTSGTGTISASVKGYKYMKTNPQITSMDTKNSGNQSAPTGININVNCNSDWSYYYAQSTHTCSIKIGTGTYTDQKTIEKKIG